MPPLFPRLLERTLLASCQINLELTNGNEGRQKSWYKPNEFRRKVERYLRAQDLHRPTPLADTVDVEITRILGPKQKLWDVDSFFRGNTKELIDALVACRWFDDDSPKYIRSVRGIQDATQRADGPAIIIEVYKSNPNQSGVKS